MNELRMHQRIVQQILLVLYLLLSYNSVQGEEKLSELKNAELEKRLKLLNKPAVKTIKTKYGDTYDCVDFYKQHAFDHPLLKDHNFHPKMKPYLSRIKQNVDASTTSRSLALWPKGGGCPSGTVPVRRITKDDLIRQQDMPPPENINFDDQFVGSNNKSEQKGRYISSQGYKLAIVRTLKDPNNKFAGAGMVTSLYNPHVQGGQHSACRLKIQKGSDMLQVGWRVDPTLYGNNMTRLFIHFQAGKIQCFNALCPGFVQVSSKIPLDMSYEGHISRRGVTVWGDTMYIERDLINGNWWVLMEEDYEKVGFWPQGIFSDLKSFGTNVEWGGVAYSPPNIPKPPMGSSFLPSGYILYDGYCRSIAVINEKGETVEIHKVIKHIEDYFRYNVLFKRLSEGSKTYTYALYGGPGGGT